MPGRKFLSILLLGGIFTVLSLSFLAPAWATWTKYERNPILEGKPGEWDYDSVANQNVRYIDGVYKMWYGGNNGNIWQIGYASSSDGINWVKNKAPVITTEGAENWTIGNENRIVKEVSHPTVVFTPPNEYEMWYCVVSTSWQSGNDRSRVKYARSTDGIHWTVYPGYVLTGTPFAWDRGGY